MPVADAAAAAGERFVALELEAHTSEHMKHATTIQLAFWLMRRRSLRRR